MCMRVREGGQHQLNISPDVMRLLLLMRAIRQPSSTADMRASASSRSSFKRIGLPERTQEQRCRGAVVEGFT